MAANKIIEIDRKFGRHVGKPEGLAIAYGELLEKSLSSNLGSYEIDRKVRSDVDRVFHKPDFSLDKESIDKIRESLRSAIDNEPEPLNPEEQRRYNFIENGDIDFLEDVEGFKQLTENQALREILRSYFGSDIKFDHAASGWNNVIRSEKSPYPTAWHLDTHLRTSKTRCFIFLSDESGRNAPLQIVNREETKKLTEKHSMQYLRENPEIVEENATLHEFKGEPGDFLVFNPAKHIHRATAPTEGENYRKTLLVDFVPSYSFR